MQDFFHEVLSSNALFDRSQCMQIQIFEDSRIKSSSLSNMIHDFINHLLKISSLSNYWHYDEIFFLKIFKLFVKFFSWAIFVYSKSYFFNYFFHANMSLWTIIDSFSLRHVFSFRRHFFRFFYDQDQILSEIKHFLNAFLLFIWNDHVDDETKKQNAWRE